jgi:anti-sigma B factor antagonist
VNFSASIRHAGAVSIVDITGQLTLFTKGALRNTIAGLLQQGRRSILLNLSGLDYLDSSGIGDLVANYLTVIKAAGEMKVIGLTPKIEEILKITQLYQLFPEFQDEQSALRSFPAERERGTPSPYVVKHVSKN